MNRLCTNRHRNSTLSGTESQVLMNTQGSTNLIFGNTSVIHSTTNTSILDSKEEPPVPEVSMGPNEKSESEDNKKICDLKNKSEKNKYHIFSVLLCNVNSVKNKNHILYNAMTNNNIDFGAIVEHRQMYKSDVPTFPGYSRYCKCRSTELGGGGGIMGQKFSCKKPCTDLV